MAAESYAVFRRLRDDGVISRDVKFQVSLPTTAAFLNAHVVYSQHAVIEPIYRAKLLAEICQMVKTIAPSDLAVQWDVSTEMAQWEGVRHAYFNDIQKGVIDRLTIHCNAVPSEGRTWGPPLLRRLWPQTLEGAGNDREHGGGLQRSVRAGHASDQLAAHAGAAQPGR